MELGTIQRAWVESLKAHPERKMTGRLGQREGLDYKACCLGELLVIGCPMLKGECGLILIV